MPDALAQQIVPAAQKPCVGLLLRRRYEDDAGNLALAAIKRHQNSDQALSIGSIGLHSPTTAADLDACRIEN